MVAAVEDLDLEVHHGEAGQDAALHRLDDALLDRADELLRDRAADDDVVELEALAGLLRDEAQPAVAVLTLAAGLADMPALHLDRPGDGLAVSHLRLADVRLHLELAEHAVHQDLEVELAHAAHDGLARLLVGADAEGGVLHLQALQGDAHLVLVALGLRLDGDEDHRLREDHPLQDDLVVLVAEGVAGGGLAQADRGRDVAGEDFLDLLALVGVHLDDTADALLLVRGRVVHVRPGVELARVDAEEREVADERVVHQLERQRRERLLVGRAADDLDPLHVDALHRRDVERAREVVHHGVEDLLDALVLEGAAADHREELHRDGALAETPLQLFVREGVAVEVLGHELVVELGDGFLHGGAVLLRLVHQVGRDVDLLVLRPHRLVVEGDALHLDEIDHAAELVLAADGDLDGHRAGAQLLADGVDRHEEVGADAVHLVDEADPGHAVLVGLAPDGLGLRLDAVHAVEAGDRAVEDAQRPLDLDREVDVAGGVDDVDAVLAPEGGGRGGGDGDAALALLLHPVHDGGALMDLANLVRDAGVEEDSLGRGRLTGIDVRHDADVSVALEGGDTGHGSLFFLTSDVERQPTPPPRGAADLFRAVKERRCGGGARRRGRAPPLQTLYQR